MTDWPCPPLKEMHAFSAYILNLKTSSFKNEVGIKNNIMQDKLPPVSSMQDTISSTVYSSPVILHSNTERLKHNQQSTALHLNSVAFSQKAVTTLVYLFFDKKITFFLYLQREVCKQSSTPASHRALQKGLSYCKGVSSTMLTTAFTTG